jgi:serine/threonine protein kinase
MHGLICFQIKRFVECGHGSQVWHDLERELGLSDQVFLPTEEHSDVEMLALLTAFGSITGQSLDATLEEFGRFLAPELVSIYSVMFRPERSTLALLAVTEDVIHRVIRLRQPSAAPPVIKCLWRVENEMELIYSSPRKMCALAKGIVKGIADCFGETISIVDRACVKQGDPYCCLGIQVSRARSSTVSTRLPVAATVPSAESLSETRWLSLAEQLEFGWLPKPLEVGDLGHLAHYRLVRGVGEGGMGLVFLAEDTQLLRPVAIKVLKPSMVPNAEAVRQFVREARAAAGLTSDHVVPIYEIGEDHGLPFVVMPFLVGLTLREWFARQEPVLLGWVIDVGLGIAWGLSAAHERGLVHRDVKPSNIWLESPHRRVKLMDFGLTVSVTDGSVQYDQRQIAGTCQYMAPEQAVGAGVLPQTDLYSLGVVLYELCTGRLPVEGRTVEHTLRALAGQRPQPLRELNSNVPEELEALVMQLLEKHAHDRPATAAIVASRLENIGASLENGRQDWQQMVLLGFRSREELPGNS